MGQQIQIPGILISSNRKYNTRKESSGPSRPSLSEFATQLDLLQC